MNKFIRWFEEISIKDIPLVGGKNASLGEMTRVLSPRGIKIPPGFTITADAFSLLIRHNHLEEKIYPMLADLNPDDTDKLMSVGLKVRSLVRSAQIPESIQTEIRQAYAELSKRAGRDVLDVAVRSSATAEDLPEASFAGQQETFLNVRGEDDLLIACRNCFASLFTDRAISYRVSNGFEHSTVRLSIGVQQMVRSDLASSGIIFTLDTESGARNVVLISSAYGLGENIVGGRVDPDEFLVLKPLLGKSCVPILRRKIGSKQLRMVYSGHGSRTIKNIDVSKAEQNKLSITDDEVLKLASWASTIEQYYSEINHRDTPMDLEWAKDGLTNELFILQARPETVHSGKVISQTDHFTLEKHSPVLLIGKSVGAKIGAGPVQVVQKTSELNQFIPGNVLVADMTDPDWEPVMKKAAAIITNRGGRTCHAAIVSREHGVPCVVGTEFGTERLKNNRPVTVSCAEGDTGFVYEGILPFHKEKINWEELPKTKTKIMVNLGNPALALKTAQLPVDGVGLARMEFVISDSVKIHPMALLHMDQIDDLAVHDEIRKVIGDTYMENPKQYFVDKLAEGIGLIAGAFYPRPVIVRFSDFKTNEYANLLGGKNFEPQEENPMLGFRGASRYYDNRYRAGFALECQAIKYLREKTGLTNISVMIPFCRSPEEGMKVIKEMELNNLKRSENGLKVFVMSELPANILRADEFADIFDGFSIGSNDLTQMVLGVDRDSSVISHLFNERDPAVLKMLKMAIAAAKNKNRTIGICGQAPSDYPEISKLLVQAGIDSVSVTADAVLNTIRVVSKAES